MNYEGQKNYESQKENCHFGIFYIIKQKKCQIKIQKLKWLAKILWSKYKLK
jgi:hypothetical protein